MNLTDWQIIEHAELTIDDGKSETEYRFTFGSLTTYAEAKFNRKRSALLDTLEEKIGAKYNESDAEQKADMDTLYVLMLKHAGILAALQLVEVKDDEGKWQPGTFPEGWRDAYEFAMYGPAGVLDYLYNAVLIAGNSLRTLGLNLPATDEKKVFRLNVSAKKSKS